MKKATKFLLAAVLGLAAVFTTSCALEIVAPENKWVTYEYPYKTDKGTCVLRCHAYYSDTPTKIQTYGNPLELPAGLTIVAAPKIVNGDKTSFVELFGETVTANSYAINTFGKGRTTISADGEDNSENATSFNMGYTAWLVIYNCILHEGISTSVPTILKDGSEYKINLDQKFWKKLMYQMAINKLTELAAAE